jgi:signal peptidase II
MRKIKNNKLNLGIYFTLCVIITIAFDFMLTNFILSNSTLLSGNRKFVDIIYVQNYGAAFSTFQNYTTLLIVISIIAIITLGYILFRNLSKYSMMFYFFSSLLISGIYCNTYERITLGFVRDFFNLKFINFPVFNISDILINAGVLGIMILVVTKKYLKHD